MILPKIFEDDIQSDNIQLIPLLIIERDGEWPGWLMGSSFNIYLSTHEINITSSVTNNFAGGDFISQYYSPLLLESLIITEKIDIENRKYTISKCTFKIANTMYNGKKLSDSLGEAPGLVGKKINFGYKSINSTILIPSRGLQYLQGITDMNLIPSVYTWGDVYPVSIFKEVSPTFYYGEIRDVTHNNDVLTITAEDVSSTLLHKDLPINSLPADDSIEEYYKGNKIPMVYGYMPKSPVVMGANKKVYADSKPIDGWFTNDVNKPNRYGYPFSVNDYGALFISIDSHLSCISDKIYFPLESTQKITDWNDYDGEPLQIEYSDDDFYETEVAKFYTNPLLAKRMAQLMVVYKPSKITLQRRNDESTWDNTSNTADTSLGDDQGGWGTDEDFGGGDQLTEVEFNYMTDGDFSSTYPIASLDTQMTQQSEAMVGPNSQWDAQIQYNRYKHSLFRFVIDTEPPIEYVNRGGIGLGVQQYAHWISFGHWVMPDQSSYHEDESHHIYTYGKRSASDLSFHRIRNRYWPSYTDEDDVEQSPPNGGTNYFNSRPYEPNAANREESKDYWGNETQLCDIVRFSDYNGTDSAYYADNPPSANWDTYEPGGRSPLQFYGLTFVDESDLAEFNYFSEYYYNPYAKFTNLSEGGAYVVELGSYGWLGSDESTAASTEYYTEGHLTNISYNFEYVGSMKGWLPEVTCMAACDVKINFQNMYGSIIGRIDETDSLITHPADIIADIFVNELGYPQYKIDQNSLAECKSVEGHINFLFAFTQKDKINSKELIEDIARSTFIFPRISPEGLLKFPSLKRSYDYQTDWLNATLIKTQDVIDYSYDLTRQEDLVSKVKFKFDYDHQNDSFFGDENTAANPKSPVYDTVYDIEKNVMTNEQAAFYGVDIDNHIKEVESKYIRSSNNIDSAIYNTNFYQQTAKKFVEQFYINFYKHRHLIIKCKLPIRYLNIEVGEYVTFDNLIDNVKAYGIDYSRFVKINGQYKFPMFMCISIKKSIEYAELECLQLPHLYDIAPNQLVYQNWYNISPETIPEIYYGGTEFYGTPATYGCMNPSASNYNPEATVDDGSCVFEHYGCTDPTATNYNPWANTDDGSCDYTPIVETEVWDAINLVPGYLVGGNNLSVSFGFKSYNLIHGQFSFPFSWWDAQTLWITKEGDGYDFADPNTGIHELFNTNTLYIGDVEADQEGYVSLQSISSWNDLLPGEFTETTSDNLDYTILQIHHYNLPPITAQYRQYHMIYRLKNVQTVIGQPIEIGWEIERINEGFFSNNGNILMVEYEHPVYYQDTMNIVNRTDINLVYIPSFPMMNVVYGTIEDYSETSYVSENAEFFINAPGAGAGGLLLGDMNNDGTLDILDIVSIINIILSYENVVPGHAPQSDVNQDGSTNILDIVVMVNSILGN